jgi:hypothetical protein
MHRGRPRYGIDPLALAAALAALPGLGPTAAAGQTYVGLAAGATIARMSGSLVERADVAFGAQVGLDLEIAASPNWLIDAEFMYVQKGVSNVPRGSDLVDFRHSYLEAPITVNRLFGILGGRWAVSPYLGAAVGLNQGCGVRSLGEFEYSDCNETTPGGTARRLEVSLPLGLALRRRYPGGARLAFEARYSLGLTSVLETTGQTARNGVLALLFSFALPLGRHE